MANADVEFINDLEQILKAADNLSELNTEEAKLFVSGHLQELHNFLQKKQKDAETRIEEEIKKEENEIANLKDRIDRTAKSDGADESDVAYRNIGQLWTTLKDEFWQIAFNAFLSETEESVKAILDNLIGILMASFDHCKTKAARCRTDMMFQVYFPGENAQQNRTLKLPRPPDPKLEEICKNCQINTTPFCLPSVTQAVMTDVKADRSVSKHFKYESKMLAKAVEKYLEKCVVFSWIASLEDPEVHLITNPKKQCSKISHEFTGLDRVTYKARANTSYVEWPAVVRGNKLWIPWHLYTASHPRPKPKDMRGDPSQDYRVTGVEGKDGRLHDDVEDNIVRDKHQSYTETASADNDIFDVKNERVPENQARQFVVNGEHRNAEINAETVDCQQYRQDVPNTQTKVYESVAQKEKRRHENTNF